MKKWDIVVGTAGSLTTWTLAEVNQLFACVIALMTIVLLSYRLRREHLRRNAGFIVDPKTGKLVANMNQIEEEKEII